jgi:hypothetical protein
MVALGDEIQKLVHKLRLNLNPHSTTYKPSNLFDILNSHHLQNGNTKGICLKMMP